jgi:hypothetical protein
VSGALLTYILRIENTFRNEVEMSDWALIKQLKSRLDIA